MKAASLKEIKTELENLPPQELMALLQRLSRFKKENKELLTYLLFEATDEQGYVTAVKTEIDMQFLNLNAKNFFLAKKTIRKIIRTANKFIKYSGAKQTEIEILMHVCDQLKQTGLNMHKSPALTNIYSAQLKKINAALSTLHEDLQYDYVKEVERLQL
ncbi:MAG: hypothetical protein ABJA37_12955 [Ferruginibacter sp.]